LHVKHVKNDYFRPSYHPVATRHPSFAEGGKLRDSPEKATENVIEPEKVITFATSNHSYLE
jgi:hypothetical protein